MPTPSHAAPAAPTQATCEIWIRSKGARRQAFFRHGSGGAWQGMQVTHADRALRTGKLTIGGLVDVAVVSRETPAADEHPMHAAFGAQAAALNGAIDSLNVAARGAA